MLSEVVEALVDKQLNKAFFSNAEYIKLSGDEDKAIDSFSEGLTEQQRQMFSEVLDTKNECSAKCCCIAYEQGWKDCMRLLLDLVTVNL